MALVAKEGGCEEAALGFPGYIPCNAPAIHMVVFKSGEGPYRMCEPCARHSVNNRGAEIVGPYVGVRP
jgi:hypothetical protein